MTCNLNCFLQCLILYVGILSTVSIIGRYEELMVNYIQLNSYIFTVNLINVMDSVILACLLYELRKISLDTSLYKLPFYLEFFCRKQDISKDNV